MDDTFSEEELLQLNEFFSTNPGRKLSDFTFINSLGQQVKELIKDADIELIGIQQRVINDKKKE